MACSASQTPAEAWKHVLLKPEAPSSSTAEMECFTAWILSMSELHLLKGEDAEQSRKRYECQIRGYHGECAAVYHDEVEKG